MEELDLLSVVALINDLPEKAGVYEVEFSDEAGRMHVSPPLPADQLMRLYHELQHHAA